MILVAGLVFSLLGFDASSPDNGARLELVSAGISKNFDGRVPPQRISLSVQPPSGVRNPPASKGLLWGRIEWGPKARLSAITIAVDESDPASPRLLVDSNMDGDLGNDPAAPWNMFDSSNAPSAVNCRIGSVMVPADASDKKSAAVEMTMFRFGANEAVARRLPADSLLYYSDAYLEGKAVLNGKTYGVLLLDADSTGDFTFPDGRSSNLMLVLDLNTDAKFTRSEAVRVGEPFKIGGGFMKVELISPDGSKITFAKSEPPRPPVGVIIGDGGDARSFSGPGMNGETIKFPQDYRGKLVLVDFWATWCGPCVAEIPNVVRAYDKYHSKGLEVLGVTLDREGQTDLLKQFTRDRKMPWKQFYEGKMWNSEVAQAWDVHGIPAMFLVDGDTGKIIASGPGLRGDGLSQTVGTAIQQKFGK